MVRNDGFYTIYILQHETVDGKEWNNSGDGEQWCRGRGDFREEPRRSFNALGECWQQTGVHGTYDRKIALRMMILAACEHPKRKFRITRVSISQKSDVIIQSF